MSEYSISIMHDIAQHRKRVCIFTFAMLVVCVEDYTMCAVYKCVFIIFLFLNNSTP